MEEMELRDEEETDDVEEMNDKEKMEVESSGFESSEFDFDL